MANAVNLKLQHKYLNNHVIVWVHLNCVDWLQQTNRVNGYIFRPSSILCHGPFHVKLFDEQFGTWLVSQIIWGIPLIPLVCMIVCYTRTKSGVDQGCDNPFLDELDLLVSFVSSSGHIHSAIKSRSLATWMLLCAPLTRWRFSDCFIYLALDLGGYPLAKLRSVLSEILEEEVNSERYDAGSGSFLHKMAIAVVLLW